MGYSSMFSSGGVCSNGGSCAVGALLKRISFPLARKPPSRKKGGGGPLAGVSKGANAEAY